MNTSPEHLAIDWWKIFSTPQGQALLNQITTIIDDHERGTRQRKTRSEYRQNYSKQIHAFLANLVYLHALQTKGGLYTSRSHRVLGRKRQKHTSAPSFVNKQLIKLLDTLTETDLIHQVIQTVETRGRMQNPFSKDRKYGDATVIYPTGRFTKLMLGHAVGSLDDVTREAVGEEIVLLKSHKADEHACSLDAAEVDYPDNETADAYREDLRIIQKRLDASLMIAIHDRKPSTTTGLLIDPRMRRLRRIFTRERWDSCGRYYGAWWIPLSKEERLSRIVLDGHYVAELDFSSMMVRLAYGMAKVTPPEGDQYAIPGFTKSRDCMKVLLSALLFDRPGYNRKKLPKDATEGLHPEERRPAADIIQAIKQYHKPLGCLFGKGIGHDLFFQESQIMTKILLKLHGLGITGLPVHDAIYVPVNRVVETKTVMEEAFRELVGMEGIVRVTLPPAMKKAA